MNFFKSLLPQATVDPALISIHIPKTAGTSFAEILKYIYGYQQVGSLHIQKVDKQGTLGITYQDKPCRKDSFSVKTKVLHGHFHYRRIATAFQPPANTPIITWLRHPVARVVSAYRYADNIYRLELSEAHPRLHILNTLKRNLMEFAQHPGNRNLCSKYLEGVRLEDLHFVGIVEHFEEDLAYLAQLMGWGDYKIPHLNRTKERPPLADFKYDAIRLWNQQDMALYEQALELRKQRI